MFIMHHLIYHIQDGSRLLPALRSQQSWLVRWILSHEERPGSSGQELPPEFHHSVLDERDEEGRTPLHLAARWGNLGVVKALVEKGADVQSKYYLPSITALLC